MGSGTVSVDRVHQLFAVVAAPNEHALNRLLASEQLRVELRALEHRIVADARNAGFSWQEIGDALGISKQGAHIRYSS